MSERVLLTGACGFVGHHFCEHFLKHTDWEIVILDKLNYASSGLDRLRDIKAFDGDRVKVLSADFSQPISEGVAKEIGDVKYIFHLGAESHVDNSIEHPEVFVESNVVGTLNMLQFTRTVKGLKCFFYFSTDEVFGAAPEGVAYKEDDPLNPTNPYSASKAGGEMLVKAFRNTYKLPAIITRSMNIFGERQDPEKFIPMTINKILAGDTVIIHSNKDKTKAGSRFYIHARNVADGYMHLIDLIECDDSLIGQEFHITGEQEVDNLELAKLIASVLGKELKYEMLNWHESRPGHDLRYALSGEKMAQLGWSPPKTFGDSLAKTIDWTVGNDRWLKRCHARYKD